MVRRTVPFAERLVSKRRIERQETKILGAIELIAQNTHEVSKVEESIKKLNGGTLSFIKAQKKFLEYKKHSAVKQNELLEVFVNESLVKAKELQAHNEQLASSRKLQKG